MLQRVVWNRLEFRVSLPVGSIFTGGDDGFFDGSEQAQSLQARSMRLGFHCLADLAFIWSLRDLPVKVLKKLTKIRRSRLEGHSLRW